MAASEAGDVKENINKSIFKSKILLVGAGGIGCELLKDLVLSGFDDIHVIDLDTIDVSNLNRQFLFRKQHVGQSKAEVARASAQILNPKAKIRAYHDSITSLKYDIDFFKQFAAVTNALDNLTARKHVNRMCLAADIPLIESGSSGYLGQVTLYRKKVMECFECVPRPTPKEYPTCTIRNTPSETIHCVVWAKHLFNQLFGEDDPHQDVSPDTSDPESGGVVVGEERESKEFESKTTLRDFAKICSYEPIALFHKLFRDDIDYLLKMESLWELRNAPFSISWDQLSDAVAVDNEDDVPQMKDQRIWSIKECGNKFKESLEHLKEKLAQSGGNLSWEKDDNDCMNFVTACTNIRAHCFNIKQESKFKIKSMAGNIIPAIATTNAIVGGLVVLQLVKLLKGSLKDCRNVVVNGSTSILQKKLFSSFETSPPNPKCFVCSPNTPEVYVKVNLKTVTVKTLRDKILIERLNMIAPDVLYNDGKGTILVSSDQEDMEDMLDKTLASFNIFGGVRLPCDDFFQHFALTLILLQDDKLTDQEFDVVSDTVDLKPTSETGDVSQQPSTSKVQPTESKTSDNEPIFVEQNADVELVSNEDENCKRKMAEEENGVEFEAKRQKLHPEETASAVVE